jgi:hypothetical protein
MRYRFWLLSLLTLATIGGCAQPVRFAEVAPSMAGPPPGMARIVVYRNSSYQSPSWAPVFFNGARVSAVGPGYVTLRDVPPGTYNISVSSPGSGVHQNQNQVVAAAPGQTFYLRIEAIRGIDPSANRPVPLTTFVLMPIDPQIAQQEIAPLFYTTQNEKGLAAASG